MSLALRASMLERVRSFFKERGVLEVDCNALLSRAPLDAYIDVFSVPISEKESYYLHTSPEYAMKKLLAQGSGDIYYLGHVFRKEERGRLHSPEFTMVEWYRIGFTLQEMIEETAELLSLFLRPLPLRLLSYRDAFLTYVGLDPFQMTLADLQKVAGENWDFDTCAHFLLTHAIEPHLGQEELTALIDYPPQEAALARTTQKNGIEVAMRFEIYYRGIELTNGYHELSDAEELRRRLLKEGAKKSPPYLLDEELLAAMETFPPCCGVSVGFDRALMLMMQHDSI